MSTQGGLPQLGCVQLSVRYLPRPTRLRYLQYLHRYLQYLRRYLQYLESLVRGCRYWRRARLMHEVGEQVDGDGEHDGGVVLRRDAVQGLQVPQLKQNTNIFNVAIYFFSLLHTHDIDTNMA